MKKTLIKYTIILSLLIFWGNKSVAQQLPLYTQYQNNGFLLNPAMAGYDGYTSFNVTTRKQWLGFQESPLTYSFSGQTRLLKRSYRIINKPIRNKRKFKPSRSGRVGLGGFVFNDVNGLVSRTGMQFSYAYHIYMLRSQLSFGLGGQMFQYKIDRDRITTFREGDPTINSDMNIVAFIPDFNFGVYWTSRTYFVGFSANQLFQSPVKLGSNGLDEFKLLRHYYLMGGYRIINEYSGFDFEPSFLLKTTEQLVPQADISFKVYYKKDYWAGISYRTSGTVAALFGVKADSIYVGYAFDFPLSSIRKYSFGSHEIFISLKFGSSARRYRWINRY